MTKRRKLGTELKREAVELTCRPQASEEPSGAETRVTLKPRSLSWLDMAADNDNEVKACMKTRAEVSLRSRIRYWLMHVRMRPALLVVGVLIVVALVVGFSGHELGRHIKSLESWITQLGLPGTLAFVGLVVIGTSLLLPETLFGVTAGVLFGLVWGASVPPVTNL